MSSLRRMITSTCRALNGMKGFLIFQSGRSRPVKAGMFPFSSVPQRCWHGNIIFKCDVGNASRSHRSFALSLWSPVASVSGTASACIRNGISNGGTRRCMVRLGKYSIAPVGSASGRRPGIIKRAPECVASYLRNTAAAGHKKPGRSELLASVQSPAGRPTEMPAEADSLAFYRGFIYGLPITLCLWAIIIASIFVL
jgi:hypothetical protein